MISTWINVPFFGLFLPNLAIKERKKKKKTACENTNERERGKSEGKLLSKVLTDL